MRMHVMCELNAVCIFYSISVHTLSGVHEISAEMVLQLLQYMYTDRTS